MRRARAGFAALVAASTISLLGTRMTAIGLPWLVLSMPGGGAAGLGVVSAAELLPYVVACALAGPLIDRLGSRRISVAADFASAVVVGAVPLLDRRGHLGYTQLVVLVAVAGLLRALGDTAKHGAVFPQAVRAAGVDMTRAAALSDGASRTASMVGTPLGAGLIALLGGAAPLLALDAASFLCCALAIAVFVRVAGCADAAPESYGAALRAGMAYVRADRLVLGLAVMVFVTNTLDQSFGAVLLPLWSYDVFHSPFGIALVSTTLGAGAVVGNIAFTAVAHRLPRWPLYAVGFMIAGGPRFALLAFGAPAIAIGVYGFVCGLAIASINPILSAVMIERIPMHLQARVSGIVAAICAGGMPLGALLAGWLGSVGTSFALLVVGGAYFLTTLAPFRGRFWREMNRRYTPDSDSDSKPPINGSPIAARALPETGGEPHASAAHPAAPAALSSAD